MTVDQVRAAKDIAEQKIAHALHEFNSTTGCRVERLVEIGDGLGVLAVKLRVEL